jgi:hypothetical protein
VQYQTKTDFFYSSILYSKNLRHIVLLGAALRHFVVLVALKYRINLTLYAKKSILMTSNSLTILPFIKGAQNNRFISKKLLVLQRFRRNQACTPKFQPSLTTAVDFFREQICTVCHSLGQVASFLWHRRKEVAGMNVAFSWHEIVPLIR